MPAFMSYTVSALEELLADTESDLAERKESWRGDAPDTGRQAVCAFANDLPNHRRAGVLFVGAKDDGTPSGEPITDELLRTLADVKTDGNTLPPPSIVVEKKVLRGAEMAVVTVLPSDSPPVRYRGRIWIRIGPRRAIATAQDERILNEKRRFGDRPFDVQTVPSCDVADLSRTLFEQEYLPNAFSTDVLEKNERTYEQRLAACKMIAAADDPVPTVLGVLVLGKSPRDWMPGAYIQFLRIDGSDAGDPISDQAVIDGPISQVLRRIDEKIVAHNRVSADITSGPREIQTLPYPEVAIQQLVRNAVMHRSYEGTNAPVRVYWFDDRIEIQNPGGPYGTVTAANFGDGMHTDYRNPQLAEALRVFGFVQHFGIGIRLAQTALRTNGNPPAEFRVESTAILATIRR